MTEVGDNTRELVVRSDRTFCNRKDVFDRAVRAERNERRTLSGKSCVYESDILDGTVDKKVVPFYP